MTSLNVSELHKTIFFSQQISKEFFPDEDSETFLILRENSDDEDNENESHPSEELDDSIEDKENFCISFV